MQIDRNRFQNLFTQRVTRLTQQPAAVPISVEAGDRVDLTSTPTASRNMFAEAVLTLATTASLGGIPALAALSQEVAQLLVTPEQELQSAAKIAAQLSSLPTVSDPRVEKAWQDIEQLSSSPHTAPVVVDSFFVDAQADARNMFIGTSALKGDMANDSVLSFTLAHEEGHRIHRDSTGSAGLETLLELCREDEKLFPLAFQALGEGRRQNEREADSYAARLLTQLPVEQGAVMNFLSQLPGDLQHPDGKERAEALRSIWDGSQ